MKVKTISAPSIHAALMEARRTLGDEVVLLESIPASGDELARITVMADGPARTADISEQSNPLRGYGYQPEKSEALAVVSAEESTFGRERLSAETSESYPSQIGTRRVRDLLDDREYGNALAESRRRGAGGPAGRGQLFPNRGELVRHSNVPAPASSFEAIERLLEAQLALLHERLDRLERRFDGAIIGASQAWTTNPLFASMLRQGFRPGTVTRLFEGLASNGYQPDTDIESLKWALAQAIRRSIDLGLPKQTNGAQVFVGPSGSGKTSLLLKLAKHSGFYGHRSTAVIIIEPEDSNSDFHNSPIDLFRRYALPVQTVASASEMEKAIVRVQHFDHILIDTPAMALDESAARKQLRHIKRLIDPIMPHRVQFVLNATRAMEDFDAEFVQKLALRPEAIALTHLDEVQGWGRIGEWLMALEMPVQFISTSSNVPDGVMSFSPTWFVEEMMNL